MSIAGTSASGNVARGKGLSGDVLAAIEGIL
jgi:hypothetical protein